MRLHVKMLEGGRAPEYKSAQASGMDCFARVGGVVPGATFRVGGLSDRVYISRLVVPLGFCVEVPAMYAGQRYEGQIRPRSGMARDLGVVEYWGTIDADYRGEVSAMLFNYGSEDFAFEAGDRLCQMVIAPVQRAVVWVVDELTQSERGDGGFGSSGMR